MNDSDVLSQYALPDRIREFVGGASDLYVSFLTDRRKKLATSLLSGLVLAIATLDEIHRLPLGPARSRQTAAAAAVFHKLSLLIFASGVYNDDEYFDVQTQHAYDTAADLSGLLSSAARRS